MYFVYCIDTTLSSASMQFILITGGGGSMTLPRKLSFGSSALFAISPSGASTAGGGGGGTFRRRLIRTESTSGVKNNNNLIRNNPPSVAGDGDCPVDSSASKRPHLGSASQLDTPSGAATSGGVGGSASPNANVLLLQGHKLQRIQFRGVAVTCDHCRQPCCHLIHPPAAFQCVHCQVGTPTDYL